MTVLFLAVTVLYVPLSVGSGGPGSKSLCRKACGTDGLTPTAVMSGGRATTEPRGDNLKGLKGFYLEVKARIWP